ncbi:BtpA/SgcQ family protein [Candidatus Bipolaricaulota sp. J31]
MRETLFHKVFPAGRPLIGVIHLPPLPGSPRYAGGGLERIVDRALADLAALEEGGADAAIVENFGDLPLPKRASKVTVAAMAAIARELTRAARIPLGINVLRSDGEAALGIAAAAGARFIRVNVFCGVALTDQGIIEGEAERILGLRASLDAEVAILADVHVKHAHHFGSLAEAARDAARNLADAIIVTGSATGEPASPGDVAEARRASALPVLVGSGVTPGNIGRFAAADGFIVGTYLKRDGVTEAPVDPTRVREVRLALDRLGQ